MRDFEIEFHAGSLTEEQADLIYRHHGAAVAWHGDQASVVVTARGATAFTAEHHIRTMFAGLGVTDVVAVRRDPVGPVDEPRLGALGDAVQLRQVAGFLDDPGAMVVISVPSKGMMIKLSAEDLANWMDESSVEAELIGTPHTALRFAGRIQEALELRGGKS